MRPVGYLVAIVFFLAWPSDIVRAQKKEEVVEGYVVDNKGKALAGVEVSLYVEGNSSIESMKTDKDGKFRLKITDGVVFTIMYTHTKLNPAVVKFLSGEKSQNITKVMFPKGTKTAMASAEYLDALDYALFYLASLGRSAREKAVFAMKHQAVWPEGGLKKLSFMDLKIPQSSHLQIRAENLAAFADRLELKFSDHP